MRILYIEDDASIAMTVELMMKSEGFNVYTTDLGEEGVDLAKIYDYDLILCDLRLPDMDGMDVIRQIRAAKVSTPIMVVSGRHDVETKVRTFGAGADDYMTKPFHKDEMVARAHALIRRSKGHADSSIVTGEITVNLDRKCATVGGHPLHLTGKEYLMLELLSLRKGQTISKDQFLNHLYGGMDEPELKIIDVFICKLRTKLRTAGAGGHIDTTWGRGYVLIDEPVAAAEPTPRGKVGERAKPPPMETVEGQLMAAIDGGTHGPSFLAEKTGLTPAQVYFRLNKMRRDKLVMNNGSHKRSWWVLMPAGVEFLRRNRPLAAAA